MAAPNKTPDPVADDSARSEPPPVQRKHIVTPLVLVAIMSFMVIAVSMALFPEWRSWKAILLLVGIAVSSSVLVLRNWAALTKDYADLARSSAAMQPEAVAERIVLESRLVNADTSEEQLRLSFHLAKLSYSQGDLAESDRYYLNAHVLAEQLSSNQGIAKALLGRSTIAVALGDNEHALVLADIAESKFTDAFIHANANLRRGIAKRRTGELVSARSLLESSLEYWKQARVQIYIAETLIALGDLYTSMDEKDRAHDSYSESLRLVKEIIADGKAGRVPYLHAAQALCGLARAYIVAGDMSSARKSLDEIIGLPGIAENHFVLEMYYQLSGRLYHTQKKYDEAAEEYRQSILSTVVTGNQFRQSETLCFVADTYFLEGKSTKALSVARAAGKIASALGAYSKLSRIHSLTARTAEASGLTPDCAKEYARALEYASQSGPVAVMRIYEDIRGTFQLIQQAMGIPAADAFVRQTMEQWANTTIDDLHSESYFQRQFGPNATPGLVAPLDYLTALSLRE